MPEGGIRFALVRTGCRIEVWPKRIGDILWVARVTRERRRNSTTNRRLRQCWPSSLAEFAGRMRFDARLEIRCRRLIRQSVRPHPGTHQHVAAGKSRGHPRYRGYETKVDTPYA